MTCDEFLAALDTNNPFYQEFRVYVKGTICKDLLAYPKGLDLPERVDELLRKKLYPLVDKKTQMVIGIPEGGHNSMRWLLHSYHKAYENPGAGLSRQDMASTWYLTEGMGYYISSKWPSTIIVEDSYERDGLDVKLFRGFTLDDSI